MVQLHLINKKVGKPPTMADLRKHIVSNCLCFMINKFGKIASKPLKQLILEFYSADDISEAKELLMLEIDGLKTTNPPKITRHRRDSVNRLKPALDIDDIIMAICYLDESQVLDKCSIFVANNPDNMPSTRLVEGDLEVVW